MADSDEDECNLFAPDEEESVQSDEESQDPLSSKAALISPSSKEYDLLVKKISNMIETGHGETLFEIGVGDGGSAGLNEPDMVASVATLQSISEHINCAMRLLREKEVEPGKTAEYLLRVKAVEEDFSEVRVAVVGNVDAGKSTLLGVLTHGCLDDGRGTARLKLFRHKHEAETGRTSSVGNDILGFDDRGEIVNKPDKHSGALDWQQICRESAKVLTFIDLAGHEKYLKTTVFGMTGHNPDFAMLMVGSNAGIVGMTKEHLGLALALNVPVFVVVTKIDMCPANVLADTMKLLTKILKSPGCRKIPVIVSSPDDVIVSATNFISERICPIFQVSNVTGENLDLLKMFMNLLTMKGNYKMEHPPIFQIDDTYSVPGVGTVVSGTTLKGIINLNDILMLGPDALGNFQPVPIKSIHRKRMPVKEVRAGQTASFSLKKVKRQEIRKGMVLMSRDLENEATWEFEAEILVLHHPTTISAKYQAMVHCGSLRQTATIIKMDAKHLRTGDKAMCHFRFIKTPEFVEVGSKMIFREGRTKAVGSITKLFKNVEGKSTHNTGRQNKQYKAQMHNRSHGGRNTSRAAPASGQGSNSKAPDAPSSTETTASSTTTAVDTTATTIAAPLAQSSTTAVTVVTAATTTS